MVRPLELFLEPLARVTPALEASLRGEWSTKTRRTYAQAAQEGTGERPFVEVRDTRWRGVASCAVPLAGLAFRVTPEGVAWSRSQPPAIAPEVEVSLHASAARPDGATLSVAFHGAWLPSEPVPFGGQPTGSCRVGEGPVVTGRLHGLVEAAGVSFAVLLLPAPAVKVARNRLWHLREELARPLPDLVRRLMTAGRSGVLRASDLSGRAP